jgi:endoglycosylceramidase
MRGISSRDYSPPTAYFAYQAPFQARSRYLSVLSNLAQRFANMPGVIGYDLLNEPFFIRPDVGRHVSTEQQLDALYGDGAAAIRRYDSSAILFLEPDLRTDTDGNSQLPPPFAMSRNVAYAPHFYDPDVMGFNPQTLNVSKKQYLGPANSQQAFERMRAFASDLWGGPLFVGEFGAPVDAAGAGMYLSLLYDLLDGGKVGARPVSGAQWSYTPGWTPQKLDGWNGEDLSIVNNRGLRKQLFVPRAYAQQVSGTPTKQVVGSNFIHLEWSNQPKRSNQPTFFVPSSRPITPPAINTFGVPPDQLDCRPVAPQKVLCTSGCWQKQLKVTITYTPMTLP